MPRDLSARVAEGRVYRLRREERLRPIFRAKALLADLLASPLARLAAAGQVEPFPNATTAGLDLRLACTTWLRQILRGDWAPTRLEEGALLHALRDADAKDWQARWGTARAPRPGARSCRPPPQPC